MTTPQALTRLDAIGSYAADDCFESYSELAIEAPALPRRPLLATAVSCIDALSAGALTFALYTYLERPVRRVARAIAFSGHWGY